MNADRPPTIDPAAALRWGAMDAPSSPWLHEEVARRMQERLQWIKLRCTPWADWEPARGGLQAHAGLVRRHPQSERYVVESGAKLAQRAVASVTRPWWSPQRWRLGPTHFRAPADGAVQMVWANMALHMAHDPQALIGQWHRALGQDGFLMFSCLGPDTLRELRALYQEQGWPPAMHAFTDMHDWGDMLVAAGFAEPVMDMERIRLSFASPRRLLQELRELGRNLHGARFAALRGRQWREQLERHLERRLAEPQQGGALALTFEVIYGHAIKPAPRLPLQSETVLSLEAMRAALRQGKKAVSPG